MKFKTSQFKGYNDKCITIKQIKAKYEKTEFTLEEMSIFINRDIEYVIEEAYKLAKTDKIKSDIIEHYFYHYNLSISEIKKLLSRKIWIEENYNKGQKIVELQKTVNSLRVQLDTKRITDNEDVTYKSTVILSMNIIWSASQNSNRITNDVMRENLYNLIKAGVDFHVDDFNYISSNFRSYYWFNKEYVYSVCIDWNNTTAIKSFEHTYQRVAFILNNQRMYVGKRINEKVELPNNKYKMHYYFVTSFTDDNKQIRLKSSSDYEAKKDYKLLTLTNKEFKEFFKDRKTKI